jgi:hypothetical protein
VKRKQWALAGAAVLIAISATSALIVTPGSKQSAHAALEPPSNTETVREGTLSATVSESGTLTYQGRSDGSPYTVINHAPGTYTELPAPGNVISQGETLYRVNDSPIVLLYGAVPAYRTLTAGMTGADVTELNADLVALGFGTTVQLDPTSDVFGSATTGALERFQRALGVTQNGTLTFGQAVFEPAALRVTAISGQLGANAESGQTAMQATSTTRVVEVTLDASWQTRVTVGDTVTITLPNNQTTPGVVASVGTVASCPSSSGATGPNASAAAPGTDSCSTSNLGGATPTLLVDVTPSDPTATGTWDQAPVRVGITTASVTHALAVPVTALLAQSGSDYSVEVVGPGGTTHLVTVSLGVFDDAHGTVQVTGSGLAAGQKVVVAST